MQQAIELKKSIQKFKEKHDEETVTVNEYKVCNNTYEKKTAKENMIYTMTLYIWV